MMAYRSEELWQSISENFDSIGMAYRFDAEPMWQELQCIFQGPEMARSCTPSTCDDGPSHVSETCSDDTTIDVVDSYVTSSSVFIMQPNKGKAKKGESSSKK